MKIYDSEYEARSAYYDYINNHIKNVRKAYDDYGEEICKDILNFYNRDHKVMMDTLYNSLDIRAQSHDNSKFDRAEFDGYRMKFFPCLDDNIEENKKFIKETFDAAWTHHWSNNDHHPQFWKTEIHGEPIKTEMTKPSLAEMILDWIAMSINFKSSLYYWWKNDADKEKSFMNENTIKAVNYIVDKHKDEWDFSK